MEVTPAIQDEWVLIIIYNWQHSIKTTFCLSLSSTLIFFACTVSLVLEIRKEMALSTWLSFGMYGTVLPDTKFPFLSSEPPPHPWTSAKVSWGGGRGGGSASGQVGWTACWTIVSLCPLSQEQASYSGTDTRRCLAITTQWFTRVSSLFPSPCCNPARGCEFSRRHADYSMMTYISHLLLFIGNLGSRCSNRSACLFYWLRLLLHFSIVSFFPFTSIFFRNDPIFPALSFHFFPFLNVVNTYTTVKGKSLCTSIQFFAC